MPVILIPALNPSTLCYSIALAKTCYVTPEILIYLDHRRISGPRLKSLAIYVKSLLSADSALNIKAVNTLDDFCCDIIFITHPGHGAVTAFISDIARFPNSIKNSKIIVIGDIFGIVPPDYTLLGMLRKLCAHIAIARYHALDYQLFFSLEQHTRRSLLDSFFEVIHSLSTYRMKALPEIPVGYSIHVDIMPALLSPRSIRTRVKRILNLRHSPDVYFLFLPHPADYPLFDREIFDFNSKLMCIYRSNEASEVFLACLRQKHGADISVSYGSTAVLPAMAANPLLDYIFVPINLESFVPSVMDIGVIRAINRLQRVLIKNVHAYLVSARFSIVLNRPS